MPFISRVLPRRGEASSLVVAPDCLVSWPCVGVCRMDVTATKVGRQVALQKHVPGTQEHLCHRRQIQHPDTAKSHVAIDSFSSCTYAHGHSRTHACSNVVPHACCTRPESPTAGAAEAAHETARLLPSEKAAAGHAAVGGAPAPTPTPDPQHPPPGRAAPAQHADPVTPEHTPERRNTPKPHQTPWNAMTLNATMNV